MTRRTQASALVQHLKPQNPETATGPMATYQPATVLFVDMIGFTAFCAENYPATVIEVLRDFLALLSYEVHLHGGTVEKYLGDGLMAVFDGSSKMAKDATGAVRCALAMQEAIAAWNVKLGRCEANAIQIAIGLHSGRVIVGAVGGDSRKEIAILGDSVNIASRVEGKCRCLGTSILATAQVLEKVCAEGASDPTSGFENFGFHELRGRSGYVHLYGVRR